MKQCPKCNLPHIKPGIFCSRSCANSRVFTVEANLKRANSNKAYFSNEDINKKKDRFLKVSATAKQKRKEKIQTELFDFLSITLKRERILAEQNFKCNICNMKMLWNGKLLLFQLDHISGDRQNESRENLQLICPNCHSQTDTYCGKNGTKITNSQISEALINCLNNHQVCVKLGISPSANSYKRIEKIRNKMR